MYQNNIDKDSIDRYFKKGELFTRLQDRRVRCSACAHRCSIKDGGRGICGVRINRDGCLFVLSGYVSSLNNDPIEKKPFYHVCPGTNVMSFGTIGCNLRCDFCQNYNISQFSGGFDRLSQVTAEEITSLAVREGSKGIVSTYNEPLITAEWGREIFREAKKKEGLICGYVSNGYGTHEAIDYIRPLIDCIKVDLKSFSNDTYKGLGGRLPPVLDTIEYIYKSGIWLEIVTLLIPGINDSSEELKEIAGFIYRVSPNIPWHITAFHPDYKMTDRGNTPISSIVNGYEIGRSIGLNFVYSGNIRRSGAGSFDNTSCSACGEVLIERELFYTNNNRLKSGGCFKCNTPLPGIW